MPVKSVSMNDSLPGVSVFIIQFVFLISDVGIEFTALEPGCSRFSGSVLTTWLQLHRSRGRLNLLMAILVEWLLFNASDDQWFPMAVRQRPHQIAVHPSDKLDAVSALDTPLHTRHDSCNCRNIHWPLQLPC